MANGKHCCYLLTKLNGNSDTKKLGFDKLKFWFSNFLFYLSKDWLIKKKIAITYSNFLPYRFMALIHLCRDGLKFFEFTQCEQINTKTYEND